MKVLIACESSGRVREAFRRRGHNALSCDLKPAEDGETRFHYQCDVRDLLDGPDNWDLMIAHPDCTYLTNSGVRWLHELIPDQWFGTVKVPDPERWPAMEQAVAFYRYLWNQPIPRICIENPVMHGYAKNRLGDIPRRQFVQPHYFGERMFKMTGYALKNLPPLTRTHFLMLPEKGTPEHKAWSWVHRCPPGPERKTIRSRTPPAIAKAMARQWGAL